MWRSRLRERATSLALRWTADKLVQGETAYRLRASPSCRNVYSKLGRLGKKNQKIILGAGFAVYPLLLVTPLACCHGELSERLQSGQVLAWDGLQGRWAGPVVPEAANCGPPAQGLMSIGKKGFAFDPFQGTTVITGDATPDGHLKGRLERQNSDRLDLSITFEGVGPTPDVINGTLQSGRCRWTVTLRRA